MDAFFGIIFIVGIAVLLYGWAKYKKELENKRIRARTAWLVQKFGVEPAERIMARKVWQGMTSEQLLESWGQPEDVDEKVMKSKTKQVWKYKEIGKNRYRQRVFIENNFVVGWQDQ